MGSTDDSLEDEVFETQQESMTSLSVNDGMKGGTSVSEQKTPSPTGYRNYKPPAEVLRLCEEETLDETEQIVHKVMYLPKYFMYVLYLQPCFSYCSRCHI